MATENPTPAVTTLDALEEDDEFEEFETEGACVFAGCGAGAFVYEMDRAERGLKYGEEYREKSLSSPDDMTGRDRTGSLPTTGRKLTLRHDMQKRMLGMSPTVRLNVVHV